VSGLNLQENTRRGLSVLKTMPDSALPELLSQLDRSPDGAQSLTGLTPQDRGLLIETLMSLYRVRTYAGVPIDEFVSDVCEALRECSELENSEEPQFRDRLGRLLNVESVKIAAKAATLSAEHAYTFCNARIITDARPVYGDNASEPPAAMIIAHTLKIEYHGVGGELKEIYIGLASVHMNELRDVIGRAEEKSKSLQSAFSASKIKFLDPEIE